jgi:hypothetical protein
MIGMEETGAEVLRGEAMRTVMDTSIEVRGHVEGREKRMREEGSEEREKETAGGTETGATEIEADETQPTVLLPGPEIGQATRRKKDIVGEIERGQRDVTGVREEEEGRGTEGKEIVMEREATRTPLDTKIDSTAVRLLTATEAAKRTERKKEIETRRGPGRKAEKVNAIGTKRKSENGRKRRRPREKATERERESGGNFSSSVCSSLCIVPKSLSHVFCSCFSFCSF